jgi:hypothetical protein
MFEEPSGISKTVDWERISRITHEDVWGPAWQRRFCPTSGFKLCPADLRVQPSSQHKTILESCEAELLCNVREH